MKPENTKSPQADRKLPWEEMRLDYLGDAAQLIQGGTGKLPTSAADSGDSRKPPGAA